MELSRPDVSQALKPKEADVSNKIIVNVLSRAGVGQDVDPFLAGRVAWYQVGTQRVRKPPCPNTSAARSFSSKSVRTAACVTAAWNRC